MTAKKKSNVVNSNTVVAKPATQKKPTVASLQAELAAVKLNEANLVEYNSKLNDLVNILEKGEQDLLVKYNRQLTANSKQTSEISQLRSEIEDLRSRSILSQVVANVKRLFN